MADTPGKHLIVPINGQVNTKIIADQRGDNYKHNLEKHHGEQQEIKVMVLGKFPNDPMLRQCMESVVIRHTNPEINLREEWGNKKSTIHAVAPNTMQCHHLQ